jgi:hypothetical protein
MNEIVTLLGRRVPLWAERRVTVIPPGTALDGAQAPWPDALAVVEHGAVEVETGLGQVIRLEQGAVVCFALLHAATVRNPGPGAAVVSALRRRPAPPAQAPPPAARSPR